jgi:hypothetical protein
VREGVRVLQRLIVVKRTFGCLRRNRRKVKGYERILQPSDTLLEVATFRMLLRRLPREPQQTVTNPYKKHALTEHARSIHPTFIAGDQAVSDVLPTGRRRFSE